MTSTQQHAIIVSGHELEPPSGVKITNFLCDEVTRFRGDSRSAEDVDEIVVHESVTRSVASTVRALERRGLGVHLMVGPDGHVTQHGDLATARLAHASMHNARSIGIEVVNPYHPRNLRPNLPWGRSIDATWAHEDVYVLPMPEQAEAVARLIRWLTGGSIEGLSIPRQWVGLAGGRLRMGRVADAIRPSPGIHAHQYFAHADGAWPVLYTWLRIEAGLPPCVAYQEAVVRATSVRREVDLSDFPTTVSQ